MTDGAVSGRPVGRRQAPGRREIAVVAASAAVVSTFAVWLHVIALVPGGLHASGLGALTGNAEDAIAVSQPWPSPHSKGTTSPAVAPPGTRSSTPLAVSAGPDHPVQVTLLPGNLALALAAGSPATDRVRPQVASANGERSSGAGAPGAAGATRVPRTGGSTSSSTTGSTAGSTGSSTGSSTTSSTSSVTANSTESHSAPGPSGADPADPATPVPAAPAPTPADPAPAPSAPTPTPAPSTPAPSTPAPPATPVPPATPAPATPAPAIPAPPARPVAPTTLSVEGTTNGSSKRSPRAAKADGRRAATNRDTGSSGVAPGRKDAGAAAASGTDDRYGLMTVVAASDVSVPPPARPALTGSSIRLTTVTLQPQISPTPNPTTATTTVARTTGMQRTSTPPVAGQDAALRHGGSPADGKRGGRPWIDDGDSSISALQAPVPGAPVTTAIMTTATVPATAPAAVPANIPAGSPPPAAPGTPPGGGSSPAWSSQPGQSGDQGRPVGRDNPPGRANQSPGRPGWHVHGGNGRP